jgi:hypothetical protein
MIGRAANSDIQLLEEAVSRQHARVKIEDDGTAVITDLMSAGGTLVGGKPIQRHVLRPGQTISIGDSAFVYEERAGHLMSSPSFAEKASQVGLHRTAPGVSDPSPRRVGPPSPTEAEPASPRVTPTSRTLPPMRVRVAPGAPRDVIRAATEFSAPRGPLVSDEAPPFEPLEFEAGDSEPTLEPDVDGGEAVAELIAMFGPDDGVPAVHTGPGSGRFSLPAESTGVPVAEDGPPGTNGDFAITLRRLLRYHELSRKITQGEPFTETEQQAFDALEDEFRKDPSLSANRRQWKRFPITAPGTAVWFRNLSSKSVAIEVDDIGAAGLRFKCRDLLFVPGDVISVVVRVPGFNGKQAVFSGRVAWVSSSGKLCGTMFLGPGTWQPE